MLETLRDGLFQPFDLLAQAVQKHQAAGNRKALLRLGEQTLELCRGQLVNALGTAARPGVARHEVVQTQHIGRVLPPQVRAFASYSPHGPRGLWVEVPWGQHAQT